MDEGKFQVAVGAMISRNSDSKVLLIKRAANVIEAGLWEYPAGRLHQFETFEDGLKREVKEEVGISNLEIVMPLRTFTYMRGGNEAENEVKGITFWCRTDQNEVIISNEHAEFKWLDINEAINLVSHEGIKKDLITFRDINRLTP